MRRQSSCQRAVTPSSFRSAVAAAAAEAKPNQTENGSAETDGPKHAHGEEEEEEEGIDTYQKKPSSYIPSPFFPRRGRKNASRNRGRTTNGRTDGMVPKNLYFRQQKFTQRFYHGGPKLAERIFLPSPPSFSFRQTFRQTFVFVRKLFYPPPPLH